MTSLHIIFFTIAFIRFLAYIFKNNRNPNKDNVVIKEYNFLQKTETEKRKEITEKNEELDSTKL